MAKNIITIARQYGSGGREIGEKLAKKLNIPYYDKELIAMAAKQSGFSEEVFEKADERATNSLLYSLMMGSYTFGGNITTFNDMPINDKLFLIQADIIKKAAQEGPCVIVGRCADYVLRDRKDCVNVFVHSDLASRIKRSTEQYGLPAAKAGDEILKIDKQRATYYRYYSEKKWGRAENYDLSLRSDSIGLDHCVDLIITFADMKFGKEK